MVKMQEQVTAGCCSSLTRKMKMVLVLPFFLYNPVQQFSLAIDNKVVSIDKNNKKTSALWIDVLNRSSQAGGGSVPLSPADGASTGENKKVSVLLSTRKASVSIDEKANAEYLRKDDNRKTKLAIFYKGPAGIVLP